MLMAVRLLAAYASCTIVLGLIALWLWVGAVIQTN